MTVLPCSCMSVESIIGIVSGLISISGFLALLYNRFKKQSLKDLMKKLVDQNLSTREHQKILRRMDRIIENNHIKKEFIDGFALKNRGPEAVFKDICEQNDIEPIPKICLQFMGYDMKEFRKEYQSRRGQKDNESSDSKPSTPVPVIKKEQTVYMSQLLMDRYPETCKDLLQILEKHHIKYAFLKGTKDIWCRDYMPVRTESGKLIQFRYEPSYLMNDSQYVETRSDVDDVCQLNNIQAQISDINLDGGNVLICDGRAIISDRVFSENPKRDKEGLKKELAKLLECEIIIIPCINTDFTGHADGMVRFINRNTILGNRLADEYKYWREGMQKVLTEYNLTYIDVPFFEDKRDRKHRDSAIGVYVNFLEINDLIIAPIFGRDQDQEVIGILQKAFPSKQIETINYNEVALEGGLLNCSTWVM